MSVPAQQALPIIDIGAFLEPPRIPGPVTPESVASAKEATARDLARACEDWGFFYVRNHGVDEALVARAHTMAASFFALPEEVKGRHAIMPDQDVGRGYQPVGKNVTKGAPDLHEALDVMREEPEDSEALAPLLQAHPELRPLINGRNHWPTDAEVPGFKATYEEYTGEMLGLGRSVMRAMALSLGLEEGVFERGLTDKSFWVMRVIGYPSLESAQGRAAGTARSVSCGEHTDYGCLTIVNQDATREALQVRDKRGGWVWANPVPGCFVMNIGDMFDVWTAGRYTSTPHRVLHRAGAFRTSIPFFYEPNADAEVTCLLPGGGDGRRVVYAQHLHNKVSTNFNHYD